jgi:glycine/D-amino acid oxidase-like deaminating enzyme
MQTFDWIVVGNGLTGAAVSYELARQGHSVLLIDRSLEPDSATRYSYGGIPYWSGTNVLTRQLCEEGLAKHRQLTEELGSDTEFRELDLLLTVPQGQDPEALTSQFEKFAMPPRLIAPETAQELEPLLDRGAIAGAFTVRHGHVSPRALIRAYNQAFLRLGGTQIIASVTGLVRIKARVTGVTTLEQAYPAKQVVLAAGAFSRRLLQDIGITVPLYYTHAELIETPPMELSLRTLIMPADSERFAMEAQASQSETAALWDEPGHEVTPPTLDSGAVQFRDGHLRIGQISRTLTALDANVNAAESERTLRRAIAQQLPALGNLPGQWRRVVVSFSGDNLPLVGPAPDVEGLHVFTGFSSPFVYVPPVAERFAQEVAHQQPDALLKAMAPARFPVAA